MAARDTAEEHRVSTPLELIFDLCFVVSVAQAAAELHHGLSGGHVGRSVLGYLMVFFAIWWAWMNFTWFASAYDTDDAPYRLLTMVQMGGALVLAAGVRSAFERDDFLLVTVGYLIMRVALVAQWLRAARGDPGRRAVALRYAAGLGLIQVGWVLRLLLPGGLGLAAFLPLVGFELALPIWAERAGSPTPWHPEHITERYGLFTLIVLGETILAATTAIEGVLSSGGLLELLALSAGGLLLAFGFWWAYFDREEDGGLRDHPRLAFVWGYGHYAIFAGLAALGAGLQVCADAIEHHAELGPGLAAAAVAVPVAVAVLVKSALREGVDPERNRFGFSLVIAVAVLVLAALAPVLCLPVAVLLMGAVLALALVVDLGTRDRV